MKCFHKWHPDSTDLFRLQLRRRHVLFGKLWRTFFLLRVFCACAKHFQEQICIFPVFCTWASHPKVASASSGTKASATLWKNLNWKSHVCLLLFFMNERIWNFWETICISWMPYWLWWFSRTNVVQPKQWACMHLSSSTSSSQCQHVDKCESVTPVLTCGTFHQCLTQCWL